MGWGKVKEVMCGCATSEEFLTILETRILSIATSEGSDAVYDIKAYSNSFIKPSPWHALLGGQRGSFVAGFPRGKRSEFLIGKIPTGTIEL